MRGRLIALLRETVDTDAEMRWLRDRASFNDWFNDLDWLVSVDQTGSSGAVLTDERELARVTIFSDRLNAVFADLGEADFAAYRADPRWPAVQEAARDAAQVLSH
jgi:hypothetical protein